MKLIYATRARAWKPLMAGAHFIRPACAVRTVYVPEQLAEHLEQGSGYDGEIARAQARGLRVSTGYDAPNAQSRDSKKGVGLMSRIVIDTRELLALSKLIGDVASVASVREAASPPIDMSAGTYYQGPDGDWRIDYYAARDAGVV